MKNRVQIAKKILQNAGDTIYHMKCIASSPHFWEDTDSTVNVNINRCHNSKANPNPTVVQPTCFKCNAIY
jgi:hypothetical protein